MAAAPASGVRSETFEERVPTAADLRILILGMENVESGHVVAVEMDALDLKRFVMPMEKTACVLLYYLCRAAALRGLGLPAKTDYGDIMFRFGMPTGSPVLVTHLSTYAGVVLPVAGRGEVVDKYFQLFTIQEKARTVTYFGVRHSRDQALGELRVFFQWGEIRLLIAAYNAGLLRLLDERMPVVVADIVLDYLFHEDLNPLNRIQTLQLIREDLPARAK